MKIRNPFKNLTVFEWCLWVFSLTAIVSSFLISHFIAGYDDYANLAVSLIGVTSLIFAARGDVFGMMLMIAFSLIYAFVSFMTKYYGETIIYTCMQLPCAITSLVSWFRHPSEKGTAEVKVGKFSKKHIFIMVPLVAGVTCAFYFILRAFGTANLIPGTISVATSLTALYLMILRCFNSFMVVGMRKFVELSFSRGVFFDFFDKRHLHFYLLDQKKKVADEGTGKRRATGR